MLWGWFVSKAGDSLGLNWKVPPRVHHLLTKHDIAEELEEQSEALRTSKQRDAEPSREGVGGCVH